MLELIQTVNKQGITIFMVEQNAHLALQSPTTAMCCRPGGSPCRGRRASSCTIRASEMRIWVDRPHDPSDPGPSSLAELEARLRRDVELLALPPAKDWLEPRMHPQYGPVVDVAIIGAGMSGLAAALR